MRTKLVAILLTDVSGYTAYSAQATREDIEQAIRQQQAVIPPLIEKHHGRLVKWIGDAAMVVFESATEALLCARAIQLSLMQRGERGGRAIGHDLKAVVNLGDVSVDDDGDIYGDAVNLTARLEKAAAPGEVFFSHAVRCAISRAEIPHEFVGKFEFKGIAEPVAVYRTAFGRTPVVRERMVMVATDFAGVMALADRLSWEVVQPALDAAMGRLVGVARLHGGTNRGIAGDGCFLTFDTMQGALAAIAEWTHPSVEPTDGLACGDLTLRAALHFGELHLMPHTMMGRDVHVVETMASLGNGGDVLVSGEARDHALAEGTAPTRFDPISPDTLRSGPPRLAWQDRYATRPLWRLR